MTGQTKKNKPNRRAAALCLALLLCVSAAGCSAGETASAEGAAALIEKMAEKGAFPADVVLETLDESDGVVRLQFSSALQSYIDGASSAAALEAISKTFRAFYEAGGRPIETLEIYAAGEPVTVGGVAVDCTVLMYGELPVSGVVEEP